MDRLIYNVFSFMTLCLMITGYILTEQNRLVIIGTICIGIIQFLKIKCAK